MNAVIQLAFRVYDALTIRASLVHMGFRHRGVLCGANPWRTIPQTWRGGYTTGDEAKVTCALCTEMLWGDHYRRLATVTEYPYQQERADDANDGPDIDDSTDE